MAEDSWKQQLKGPAPVGLGIAASDWGLLLLKVLFEGDLPYDDPRIRRSASTYEPEQIHLALAGHQAMVVSWSTGNATFRLGQDAGQSSEGVETVGSAASQVSKG